MATPVVVSNAMTTTVYVPKYSLQGEDLPCHVRWSGEGPISIIMRLPPELSIKEVYNLGSGGAREIGERRVSFDSFVVPGYLGILFRTSRLELARADVPLEVQVSAGDGTVLRNVRREVALFRPLVRFAGVPGELVVEEKNLPNRAKSERIALENVGEGTALIVASLRKGSDGVIGEPARAREFETKFKADVLSGLERAKTDLPGHSRLLEEFVQLLKEPLVLDAPTTRKIRMINRRARAAYKKDKALFRRVVQILAEAYFRNLELVTELSSFLDYLNSIGEGRVVLLNALDVLRFPKGQSSIELNLQIADASFMPYPPLSLPRITIRPTEAGEIPVHRLFDWVSGEVIEERR